jgi:ferredoxin
MARKLAPIQIVRRVVLGVILAGFTALTVLHQLVPNMPSVDALDPFGGLETLMKYVAGGEFLKRLTPGNIALLGGIVVVGVVLSRFFCGWLCAFGALQGVFGWLGRKIFRRRFTVTPALDKVLRYLKYVVLVAVVFFTWRAADLVIRPYDPLAAYAHLSAGLAEVWAEFAVGFVLLVVILALSMLYERAFCKYVCPLGAVNAILGRIPLFRIKRVESTCISCSACDHDCPMKIEVSKAVKVDSPECISCMECVTACPTKKPSLVTTLGGKAVRTGAIAVLGIVLYFGAVAAGQAFGLLRFTPPSLGEAARSGSLSVTDIKGSSTWAEVSSSFGIGIDELYKATGIDPAKVPADTKLKDTAALAGLESFEPDTLRLAVAKILGVPYEGEGASEAAAPASSEPPASPNAPAQAASAPAAVATPAAPAAPATAPAAPTAGAGTGFVVPGDFVLEGSMTIQAIADALKTMTQAVIARLGLPADIPVDKTLKEMKDSYGYTMAELKERIKQ